MATGAIWRVPIWVVSAPSRISENGAATSDPGSAREHRGEGEALRQPWDQQMGDGPGRAPDEQHHDEGPPMKPVASHRANTRIFANTTAISRPAPSAARRGSRS